MLERMHLRYSLAVVDSCIREDRAMKYWQVERYTGSGQWQLDRPIAARSASDACTLVDMRSVCIGAEYRLRCLISLGEFEYQDSTVRAG